MRFDESPHPETALEWWFVHGRFAGPTEGERHFLFTLFRFHVPDDPRPADAFTVLLSVLNPATGEHRASSRVDARVLDALRRTDSARSVDPFSPEPAFEELRACGLPREFECPAQTPTLRNSPMRFQWGDVNWEEDAEGISLAFAEPGSRRPLQFRLTVSAPRLSIDAAAEIGEAEANMRYVTWPRVSLCGSADGETVCGEAWFDHQWGGNAWMQTAGKPPCPRGWDWMGCRLNDGSQWVLSVHWNVSSHAEFARQLTVRDGAGEVRVYRRFEWQPRRWWVSPRTRVRYPLEWLLTVPECGAELAFTPLADDQEIPVFGPQRAIWEGAGAVRGAIGEKPVEGLGRLELQGLGYIGDLGDYLRSWAEPVDSVLAAFLPPSIQECDVRRFAGPPEWIYEPASYTRMLSAPLWDLLRRDGKRWRAVFSSLTLEALGRDPVPLRDIAFVLPELLHNASLIIDDIQDNALLRRGEEAIHRRYGIDVAISAANTAYFLPLLAVLDHAALTPYEKQSVSEIYQRLLVRAHLGQSLDLFWTHTLDETQLDLWMADSIGPRILQMYALKTGAAVEGLAEVSAVLAGSSDAVRRAIIRFARAFGLAFQLVDDVNNFSDSPGWGKERGEDLRAGKLTYVILCALRRLPAVDRSLLRGILCRPERRQDPAALQTGIDLIAASGAFDQVRQEARDLVLPAWDSLSKCVPPSTAKAELRVLWESLLQTATPGRTAPLQ